MFFYASKLLWSVLEPSTFITLLLVLGLVLRLARRERLIRLGARMTVAATVLLLLGGVSPLGTAMTQVLEDRFARADVGPGTPPITGIIILGGVLSASLSEARGEFSLSDAAERITEAVILARRFPDAKVLFVGGNAQLVDNELDEAAGAGGLMRALGVAPERIVLERRSRNTYENAVFARKRADPKPGEIWLLVTSAFHMPRAIGCFRRAGFAVEPWPVDYHTYGPDSVWLPGGNIAGSLAGFDTISKEYIGLFAYWLRGRTDALFPAPRLANTVAAIPLR